MNNKNNWIGFILIGLIISFFIGLGMIGVLFNLQVPSPEVGVSLMFFGTIALSGLIVVKINQEDSKGVVKKHG